MQANVKTYPFATLINSFPFIKLYLVIIHIKAVQDGSESTDFLEDLFIPDERETSTQQSVPPSPQIETTTSAKPNAQPTGWRIRDYYLDKNNSSNWDQIRTAWMGKNGSQFHFNNRININPHGTVDTPVTMPPIRFVNGITMPVLPTISAPTDMLPHGFPMENDDEEDTEQTGLQQQTLKYQEENPKPTPSFGLQYPWQWHNRKPQGSRYYDPQLHFHGKPTHPTFRPAVVTTRGPTANGVTEATTKPTITMTSQSQSNTTGSNLGGSNETSIAGGQMPSTQQNVVVEEASQNEKVKEQSGEHEMEQSDGKNKATAQDLNEVEKEDEREKTVFHQGVGYNETQKEQENKKENENDAKHADRERGHHNESTKAYHHGEGSVGSKLISVGRWTEGRKYNDVMKESATFENTTLRMLNQTLKPGGASESRVPQGVSGPFTKAPVELPILSQPTTKSVQNFLPGVKSPLSASTQLQSGRMDSYPPWTGAYVEHLRKAERTGPQRESDAKAGARSKGTGKEGVKDESESYQILTEESTRRVPDDGQIGSKREKTGNVFDIVNK